MKLATYSQSTQRLRQEVERLVRSRTNGAVRGLQVDVEDGRLVLSGRAPTYYAKQLATHAAMQATEIESMALSNEIVVY